jgi:hypoxanthine phosphoribosyltransferase
MQEIIEILILIFLFIVHWIVTLFVCLYVYFRKKKYDIIYLIVIVILILHWFINNNDCVISNIEKNIIYGNKKPVNSNPSLNFYSDNFYFKIIILICIVTLFMYNISYMLHLYKFPLLLLIPLIISGILYFSYFRACEIYSYKIENYFKIDHPPDYVKNDSYLNSIYNNKKNSNVNISVIINIITSSFFKDSIGKQIYWYDFNNHVSNMANNIKNSGNNFDYIIGIESGGAFVAKLLSQKLNINVLYIKASKYDEGKAFENAKIKEISDLSVIYDKNVLLVDDQILTGNSINIVKKHIENKYKPKSIKIGILYCNKNRKNKNNIDFNGQDYGIYKSPWGWNP